MKNTFLIIFLIIFSFISSQTIKLGIKSGVNSASLTGNIENIDRRTSFYLGGYLQFKIINKFVIQPEFLYSGQGSNESLNKYIQNLVNVHLNQKLKLDYINIPLMFKYKIIKVLYFEAGPQIGFLVNKSLVYEITGSDSIDFTNLIPKENYKNVDYSINIGTGYELDNGLNIGIRYSFGLSNALETDVFDISSIQNGFNSKDLNVKNSVFSVGLGYTF